MGRGGFTLLLMLLLLLAGYCAWKDMTTTDIRSGITVDNNQVVFKNINLSMVLNTKGDYVMLKASGAEYDRDTDNVSMKGLDLAYYQDGQYIEARAKDAGYTSSENITMTGSVSGIVDDAHFSTGENGFFRYNVKSREGEIRNGLRVEQGKNSLQTGRMLFALDKEYLEFDGKVVLTIAQ